MHNEVMRHLKRYLASADHVDISQYQFINLDQVQQAAGEDWTQLRSRVFVASRSIIEKHISEDDLIIQCASGFLIIFHETSGKGAHYLTNQITEEMESFFLGDQLMKTLELFSRSERLDMEAFAARLEAAQPEGMDNTYDIIAIDDPGEDVPDQTPYQELTFDDCLFHAAWDAPKEAVASFQTHGRTRIDQNHRWLWDYDLRAGRTRPEEHFALDSAILNIAGGMLDNQLKEHVRCGVIVPVSYAMISHGPTRTQYTTALARFDEDVRKHLSLQLMGAPVDAPASQLNENCRTLLPFCGRLLVHAPLETFSLKRFESVGAAAMGASLPLTRNHMLEQDIRRFTALAKSIGCPVYFDQIASWEVLKVAMKTPTLFLTGQAIGEFDALRAPYRLSRTGVLAHAA